MILRGQLRKSVSFHELTEVPGLLAPQVAHDMMQTRYFLARELSENKDVLEVACGTGVAFDYLATYAKVVIGVDIDPKNISLAKKIHGDRFEVFLGDACQLNFPDSSFDVVLLLEAIYWLTDANKFFWEAKRVLRPNGKLLIVSVNPEWVGWTPAWAAPNSKRYYSALELQKELTCAGFTVELKAGFKEDDSAFLNALRMRVRKWAFNLGLIPSTLKGRELIKRWINNETRPFPEHLRYDSGVVYPLTDIGDLSATTSFRIIYAVGTKATA